MRKAIVIVGVDTFVESQTLRCEEHRTIRLIGLTSKVVLRVMTSRIETMDNAYLCLDQFEFRKGVCTIGVLLL